LGAEAIELARLFQQPEEAIDLGRAALLVARSEYRTLDVDAEAARLEELATQAAPGVPGRLDPLQRLEALRFFLAEVCGFQGNQQDYYDPRNSFLNDVLDRRLGIPITLAVVYLEVGRRVGLPLYGVGLPGHFLVKYQEGGSAIYLDPFYGGRRLGTGDCRGIVERLSEGRMEFREGFLAAVDKRYIVLRMVQNLLGIYRMRQEREKQLRLAEMALALGPGGAAPRN